MPRGCSPPRPRFPRHTWRGPRTPARRVTRASPRAALARVVGEHLDLDRRLAQRPATGGAGPQVLDCPAVAGEGRARRAGLVVGHRAVGGVERAVLQLEAEDVADRGVEVLVALAGDLVGVRAITSFPSGWRGPA